MPRSSPVRLSRGERSQLRLWSRGPRSRLKVRAKILLGAAEGWSNRRIASRLNVQPETVARWRSRFALNGLDGLRQEAPRAGGSGRVPRSVVRRIVRATLAGPTSQGAPWSTRSLARTLHVNHMLVHRVWAAHGLQRGRSADPALGPVRPRVDLEGAFVTRGARAVVFTVQARPGPTEPPDPLPELVPNPTGRPEFAGPQASAVAVAQAVREIEAAWPVGGADRPPEAGLLVFLRDLERRTPRSVRLDAVFDRRLSQLGPRVARWFAAHPRFRAYTPAPGQRWSEVAEGWLRRWEADHVDRRSLEAAGAFRAALSAQSASAVGGPTVASAGASFVWRLAAEPAVPVRTAPPRSPGSRAPRPPLRGRGPRPLPGPAAA